MEKYHDQGEKSQVKCLVEGNILLPAMYNLNHFPRKSLREFSLRVQGRGKKNIFFFLSPYQEITHCCRKQVFQVAVSIMPS